MIMLLALVGAALLLWWLRGLSGELFTLATVVVCLYQLLH